MRWSTARKATKRGLESQEPGISNRTANALVSAIERLNHKRESRRLVGIQGYANNANQRKSNIFFTSTNRLLGSLTETASSL
jgi:hypothetical protein